MMGCISDICGAFAGEINKPGKRFANTKQEDCLGSMPFSGRNSCSLRLGFFILAGFCVSLLFLSSSDPGSSTEGFSQILPTTTFSNETRMILNLQASRKATLTEACRNIGRERSEAKGQLNLQHLIVDDNLRIIYCYVPKVASTNWKRVLLSLRHPRQTPLSIEPDAGHKQEWKVIDDFDDKRLTDRDYFKFLVVRNPFERLLSAYRNKFEFAYSNYFRERYGRSMKHFDGGKNLSAPQNDGIPSFVEFLSYISSEDSEKNEHWEAVYDICYPCHIKFDFISKYETLQRDSDFILNYMETSRRIRRNWTFPLRNETYTRAQPTGNFMESYYKSIPERIRGKLSELFRNDISLFGYGDLPRNAPTGRNGTYAWSSTGA